MKNIAVLTFHAMCMAVLVCILVPMTMNGQDKGSVTDKRDGNTYRWMKFGKQVWMVQNMKSDIPNGSWYYNNDTANAMFGRMYNWNSAITACPQGWHLPSDEEWEKLITYLGGGDAAGEKLQQMDTIKMKQDPRSAMKVRDFSSLMLGVRHTDGTYEGLGVWGGCWSATSVDPKTASDYLFVQGGKSTAKSSSTKNCGFPVRCVRNTKGK